MKKIIKRVLKYLLNKTGYFIILDVGEMTMTTDWKHYSMNVSFWGKKKVLDDMFINGERVEIGEFGIWSRHLTNEEAEILTTC